MNSIQNQKKFWAAYLMGILPAMLLLLDGYIGSLTRYIADDYCSAFWARRFGLFRSVWHWYITWSGRFSAYASDWFVVMMGSRNVRIIPPIMLAAWLIVTIVAVYLGLRGTPSEPGRRVLSIALALVFLFVVLSITPSIQTSFYWWNGLRSYTLPLLFLTLFAALYQGFIEKLQTRRAIILGCALSMVLLFASGGLSDTYAVVQLGVTGLLALLNLVSRPRKAASAAVFSAGALGTALALIMIALSPGNPNREASFPPHPGVVKLLGIAWQGYWGLLQGIWQRPEKVIALIGAICAAGWAGAVADRRPSQAWRIPAVVTAGALLSFVALLPGSWGLSEPPPARTMAVPVFTLTVGLLIAAFLAGEHLSAGSRRRAPLWALGGMAILLLNASAGIDLRAAFQQRATYITYAANWDAQEAQILAAKAAGDASVTVPSWPNWAGLDVFSDHAKNYLNQCASGYYGIEIIGRAP